MSLEITPAFDTWNQQSDAFIAVFKAFDDNGKKCNGKQFFIEYSITYDGTMPDLTNLKKIYSDASGLIILTITMPCVISLFGTYAHDIADGNKGMINQELGINYQITFQPIILSLSAKYAGPNVPITDTYKLNDVVVTATMSDKSSRVINNNDIIINRFDVSTIGNNIRNVSYYDTSLDVTWTADFDVTGIPKLLSIDADYTGYLRASGDRIFSREVSVTGTYLTTFDTGENNIVRVIISEDQWNFVDIPIITELNKGIFVIEYGGKISTITVPYETTTFLQLNVWYEGDKIEVGSSYNPNDLVIYLVYPDEPDKIRITYKDITLSSRQIIKEGWNWFTATYNYGFKQVKQWFPIFGFIEKQYIDLDFKVIYIDKITKQETDYTDAFKQVMIIEDILFISWELFLTKVKELAIYGLYIMTAPKHKGLSNQHDTDWEVLCIDDTTLKATIKYVYKEEVNNGEEIQ